MQLLLVRVNARGHAWRAHVLLERYCDRVIARLRATWRGRMATVPRRNARC